MLLDQLAASRPSADTSRVASESELIRLRYPATCSSCGAELPPGALAHWDRATKSATCASCIGPSRGEIDRGVAGASARLEFERRHVRRDTRIRQRHKHLAGLILALSPDPRSTTSWATGASGEETIGRSLNKLRDEGIAVLHDRRVPGSKANIDHIVVSPAGVFVVDTKHYRGRVEKRDVGGLFRRDVRLYVGGRDRTNLVQAMERQLGAVRAPLAQDGDWRHVPITPAIVFMSPDNWSFLDFRPLRFGDVYVLWGRALGKLLRAEQKIPRDAVPHLERLLAAALPAR